MNEKLPDALAKALGRVVADLQREWQREKDILVAESRATISECRERIVTLEASLKAIADREIARVAEALAAIKPGEPGKDADPETIRLMVEEAVAALPPAKNGKDADPAEIAALLIPEVEKAVAQLPKPKDGEPGKDADPELMREMVGEAVSAIVDERVAEAITNLPPPAAGEPGKDADPEVTAALVAEAVEKAMGGLPKAKDGVSVSVDDVRPLIADEVQKAVAAVPAAKDGVGLAGAVIDRAGALVLTLTDGSTRDLGAVVGKDGSPGQNGADGVPGRDGLGFEDMSEELADDGRTIIRRYTRGEEVKEFRHRIAVVLDRGVYKAGTDYEPGDGVTFGGSFWIAQENTSEKPGEGKAFRLAVKRGRDGKDGEQGKPGIKGDKGDPGRDGGKW